METIAAMTATTTAALAPATVGVVASPAAAALHRGSPPASLRGLEKKGNYCFANSVLQLLALVPGILPAIALSQRGARGASGGPIGNY